MNEAFELASQLLDRWLQRLDPDAKARLHQIGAGRLIRVRSRANSVDLYIEIDDDRVNIRPVKAESPPRQKSSDRSSPSNPHADPADLDIEFSLALLSAPALGLDPRQWRERGWLTIKGDIGFAENLLELSSDMPETVGDFSQPFIGATGAMVVDKLLDFIRNIFANAINNLRQDTLDYLQYEGKLLADANSVTQFRQLCEGLLDQIDALEQRLDNLES